MYLLSYGRMHAYPDDTNTLREVTCRGNGFLFPFALALAFLCRRLLLSGILDFCVPQDRCRTDQIVRILVVSVYVRLRCACPCQKSKE